MYYITEDKNKKLITTYSKDRAARDKFLREQKIRNDQRFDGFLSITTNNTSLSTAQILDAHKQLYKIEQSFRSFKTFLETRPMYPWTGKRILGYLALCYISFTLLNHLQLRLKHHKTTRSEDLIKKALVMVQMSKISQNKTWSISSGQAPHKMFRR